MIRILIAFKIIDDYDDILPADWENLGTNPPDTSYSKRILNCFDEAALENALLIREALVADGSEVQLTALTVCPGYSSHILKNLPAIGFDRVCTVETDADLRFDPFATASLIAGFAKDDGGFDLILTGKQAPPANSGMVPLILSELLEAEIIPDVSELSVSAGEGLAVVTHALDDGICVRKAPLPLICAMGNAVHSYLRIPTLREKLAAKAYVPEQLRKAPSLASGIALQNLAREHDERACVFVPGSTPAEMAAAICENCLRGMIK